MEGVGRVDDVVGDWTGEENTHSQYKGENKASQQNMASSLAGKHAGA